MTKEYILSYIDYLEAILPTVSDTLVDEIKELIADEQIKLKDTLGKEQHGQVY